MKMSLDPTGNSGSNPAAPLFEDKVAGQAQNLVPMATQASGKFTTPDGKIVEIREVWAYNLDEEMEKIREILIKFPYVAMDTEFPGVVARPVGDYGATEVMYQTLKCNVDMLKLIQLGLTFTDKDGNWAEDCTCWQFNFKFSLSGDMFAQDSIDLLINSGIDFEKFEKYGVSIQDFGEAMTMSGLVLNDEVKWTSFHSSYDFGYLVKTLTCSNLPVDEQAFLDLLHTFFPCIYDVKYMMTAVEGMYGGLSALADTLQVDRIGPMHQAGSDSMLTAQTFFSLVGKHLAGNIDDSRFKGELFGMGNNHTKHKAKNYFQSQTVSGSNGNLSSISMPITMNNGLPSASAPHLQYYGNVHYPPQHQFNHANNGFGYQEDFQDLY